MAYAMLERPKLLNARSLKFYPQNCDHHNHQSTGFRHKTLPPDFDLDKNVRTYSKGDERSLSLKPRLSSEKKCPIYVHNFGNNKLRTHRGDTAPILAREEGDFLLTSHPPQNTKKKRNFGANKLPKITGHKVMDKLEESYWATWKPDNTTQIFHHPSPLLLKHAKKEKPIKIIKEAPRISGRNHQKIKIHPQASTSFEVGEIQKKSQEIQTDNNRQLPPMILEGTKRQEVKPEIINEEQPKSPTKESKLLKHTDSFTLITKKNENSDEKEHLEQPKCIRLYKKPGSKSAAPSTSFIKGGSYPLKSCLKPITTSFHKANVRLGRPGSPLIVSSSHASNNNKHANNKHHHKRF